MVHMYMTTFSLNHNPSYPRTWKPREDESRKAWLVPADARNAFSWYSWLVVVSAAVSVLPKLCENLPNGFITVRRM